MRISKKLRPLTHGYCAHGVYAAIVIQFFYQNLALIADALPFWLTLTILLAALALRLVKQESVSGDDRCGANRGATDE
jgi:hypothetical protein